MKRAGTAPVRFYFSPSKEYRMRRMTVICSTIAIIVLNTAPSFAQSAPGQTVNVTPNQQTTTASAVSNPTGQNISQQNNFYDPGSNAFGPGIQCTGPYLASSVYRNDSSSPGTPNSGFSNLGGTVGLVVPLNGSNKKCQEFVNEILFQRQLDTCLSMMKQGFAFDPDGQYASLAKRCSGIKYTGQPISSANPLSPPQPPTVITVPANPSINVVPIPNGASIHAQTTDAPVATQTVARAPVHITPTCQTIDPHKKRALLERFKAGKDRRDVLETLHAACVPDSEIMAAL
jgi:hypothetical protein